MLEDLIAYAAVGCAGIYASWRLLPAAARFSLAEHGGRLARSLGFSETDPDAAPRRADARLRSPCGSCGGCARRNRPAQVMFINNKDS